MSFRTKLMLSMAQDNINKQKKWLPSKSKNLRSTRRENEAVNTTEPNSSLQYGKEKPEQDSNKDTAKPVSMDSAEVFLSPVLNETSSSYVNKVHFASEKYIIYNDQNRETIDYSEVEDNDDSDNDPNYSPKLSVNENESDEENLIVMGAQLEINLMLSIIQDQSPHDMSKSKLIRRLRQNSRNTGKEYKTGKGRLIRKRVCQPLAKCRKNCAGRISYESQKQLFETYWNLGSYTSRIIYLAGLISIEEPKTRRQVKSTVRPKIRKYSCIYHLKIGVENIDVCQKCFRTTFDETDNVLKTTLKKKMSLGETRSLSDLRGADSSHSKLSDEKVNEVKCHVNSFPSYESHYSRRHTKKRYFQSDLSVAKMYKMYREQYSNPVSLTKYSQIFKGMDIKFKQPQSDVCSTCEKFKIQIAICTDDAIRNDIIQRQKMHHEQADVAYKCKSNDKLIAQTNSSIKVFAFDLQQCLPTPYLENSLSFYKRQLWTFNFTVHDLATNQPYCYMWNEVDARRGYFL